VDEAIRGYFTKYDCSAADLNPIGAICKGDLKRFLAWAAEDRAVRGPGFLGGGGAGGGGDAPSSPGAKRRRTEDGAAAGFRHRGYPALARIAAAAPTAELEPITAEYQQTDEVDMGMTYDELGWYGRLRKIGLCGPVSMFRRLCAEWGAALSPTAVAQKVQFFFRAYGRNRHKMTTLTPSYHAEMYSPDDNRFDLRQFLYPLWGWQFRRMDAEAAALEQAGSGGGGAAGSKL